MSPVLNSLPTIAFALAVVLGLVWLASKGSRFTGLTNRLAKPGGTGRLSLQDTIVLDPTRRLHVIRCDDEEFVLLIGGGQDVVVRLLPLSAADAVR